MIAACALDNYMDCSKKSTPTYISSIKSNHFSTVNLQHLLKDKAVSPSGVAQSSFVNGALRELSVGFIRGKFLFLLSICWHVG
jgi:hypothetical protein